MISFVMLMFFLSFYYVYAADYDFNKFSGLAKQRYGAEVYQNVLELQQLIVKLKSASEPEKLKQINDFFNQKIKFTDDIDVWDKSDYWATPLESLGRGAGDCEDYSIAKYMFLKILNIPNDKLRLIYVRAENSSPEYSAVRAHMVLGYYSTPESEPLILDNLKPGILPASRRPDLSPIFSFNDKALWTAESSSPKGRSQSHLSRWRDVLSRIHSDGIE